jgi:SAM-dependent methyltransferase
MSRTMSKPRPAHAPWRRAGRLSEDQHSADDVVRSVGWVFNQDRLARRSLGDFVESGDADLAWYGPRLDLLWADDPQDKTFVELGAGIGRMTAGLTHHYGSVIACDLDAAFLERCRETVAAYGDSSRLRTVRVDDARTLALPDACADIVFSYLTLQHCNPDDALCLVAEAMRVVKPGGRVALQFRARGGIDPLLVPLSKVIRGVWHVVPRTVQAPRLITRAGWQANRLSPGAVVSVVRQQLPEPHSMEVIQADRRRVTLSAPVPVMRISDAHPSHWWLKIVP